MVIPLVQILRKQAEPGTGAFAPPHCSYGVWPPLILCGRFSPKVASMASTEPLDETA